MARSVAEKHETIVPKISRNIVANFVGTAWTGIMGPALVSVYVRFMGIEAYGLVGILTTLQAVFTLLDLGLSTTLNRELARLSVRDDSAEQSRDLVRTAEILYWSLAGGIATIVLLLTPFATRWVHAQHLSSGTIRQAFLIMGFILAFQFPFALYSGGLMGLQRQVLLNAIMVGSATARGLGSILLLWLVAPTVQVFFAWQLLATLLQTGLSAVFLWRSLPHREMRPRFRQSLLRAIWRFAAGMTGISFFALLLTQTDKIVLSRLLPLEKFGYYVLATVIASSLYVVVVPVFAAVFPRFSQLVASDDEATLRDLYHRSCQFVSVALLPIATVLALFAPEILRVWTRDPLIVQNAHLLVSLLVVGTALNGLMNIPYALQLASGWTKLALYQNMIAVVVLIPLLFWATNRYGALGAAAIWITVNAGYVFIGIQVMHTRLLRGDQYLWYTRDIGLPIIGAFSAALFCRLLFPGHASTFIVLGNLVLVFLAALLGASTLTPVSRTWIREVYTRFRAGRGASL